MIAESEEEREEARAALHAEGYSVATVGSGFRALQDSLQPEPDLIVLDYRIGDPFCAHVLQLLGSKEDLRRIPILVLSTKPEKVLEIHRGIEAFVEVLPKPLSDETFLGAVKRSIEQNAASECCSSSAVQEGALPVLRSGLGRDLIAAPPCAGNEGLFASASVISFSDLVQALDHRKVTGMLVVANAKNTLEVHLLAGSVCFLNPRKINFGYSRELCFNFLSLRSDYLEEALGRSACEGDSIFFHMVEDGILRPENLTALMVSLGVEILKECILEEESLWFSFRPEAQIANRFLEFNTGISPEGLILRLYSHLDEWKALQDEGKWRDIRFVRRGQDGDLGLDGLSEKQSAILRALEGPRTLFELSSALCLSPFEVWRGVSHLQGLGLVENVQIAEEVMFPSGGSA